MIYVTPIALNQIKKLLHESTQPQAGLRVAVVGGGCSGMSYKLDFIQQPNSDDKVFVHDNVSVFVDPKSYLYLKDLTLDYSGGLNGTGFTFKNPNAQKSCGCGTSFSVA